MAFTQPFRMSTQLRDAAGHKDSFQLFGFLSTTATVADIPTAVRTILGRFAFINASEYLPIEFSLLIPVPSNVAGPALPDSEIEQVCLWKMRGSPGKRTPLAIDVPGIYLPAFPDGRVNPAESGIASLNQLLINGTTTVKFHDRNGITYATYEEAITSVHRRIGEGTRHK